MCLQMMPRVERVCATYVSSAGNVRCTMISCVSSSSVGIVGAEPLRLLPLRRPSAACMRSDCTDCTAAHTVEEPHGRHAWSSTIARFHRTSPIDMWRP